jgi:hypothetical protein
MKNKCYNNSRRPIERASASFILKLPQNYVVIISEKYHKNAIKMLFVSGNFICGILPNEITIQFCGKKSTNKIPISMEHQFRCHK